VGWNPDVIWVPNYADYTVEDVLNAPEFSSITAVQNGAVYTFPCELEPLGIIPLSAPVWVLHGLPTTCIPICIPMMS